MKRERQIIKNHLCFVILIKLLANGTERTLDTGNNYKTE